MRCDGLSPALPVTAPAPTAPEPARWVRFHGRRPAFRPLAIPGVLLVIPIPFLVAAFRGP